MRPIRQAIGKNDAQGKIRNANDYFHLLTQHIHKENELFVSWFKLLNSYDKDLLNKEFEKMEEKVIGTGKPEEYLINLKNMKSQIHQNE